MIKKSVLPILQLGINYLTEPQDILLYILRHYIYMPKNINDTFNDLEESFSFTEAEFENNEEALIYQIETDLKKIIQRYFPNNNGISVIASIETIEKVDKEKFNKVTSKNIIKINMGVTLNDINYSIKNALELNKNTGKKLLLSLDNDNSFVYNS